MEKVRAIDRIQEPIDYDTIRRRVDYALNNGYHEVYKLSNYLFSLPYPNVPIYKQPYENPDAQLEDICELPINHTISIETARQARVTMEQITDKPSDKIGSDYTKKHRSIITLLGARYGFQPVLSDVKKYIHQINNNPVLDKEGTSVHLITLEALQAYESVSSHLAEGEEERIRFWKGVGLKGLWSSGAISALSRKKQEESIDLFIDCFSRTENLDDKGNGEFTYSGLNQLMNFPFVMEYLITRFGRENIEERFRQEQKGLKDDLIKLFDFYHP